MEAEALSFDANGNLLSDGQRNYSWDAENRLVGIAYPAQSGKATSFAYDGLSRRTAITRTPAGGGSAAATSYIWCGSHVCQARNASGATTREYYTEGEFVPGSPAQPYYYGVDQIGSVRRAFTSASSAPAFSYDAYGNALQTTAPVTDFNYAGMFYNVDSGLYLTQYRAYDSVSGRWLSRDPIGDIFLFPTPQLVQGDADELLEDLASKKIRLPIAATKIVPDPMAVKPASYINELYARILLYDGSNLYGYVRQNPISLTDLNGLAGVDGFEEMKAQQFISLYCQGGIMSVFPGQFLECTIGQIQAQARCGNAAARTALKLLGRGEYRK